MALPKPYYEDGSVTIYHGDARAILPSLGHIDLLLTDPPYGLDCSDTYSSLKGTPAFNAKKGNYGGKKYPKMAGDTEPFAACGRKRRSVARQWWMRRLSLRGQIPGF